MVLRLDRLVRLSAIASVALFTACQSATTPDVSTSETTETSAEPAETATGTDAPQETALPDPESDAAEATPTEDPQTTASPSPAAIAQSCSARAFVTDPDPAGLNVRNGPGTDFAVLDVLPTTEPVEVSIVGTTDGWFLINEAQSASQQELDQPGWVYAPHLGVTTTSISLDNPDAPAKLYEAPDGFSGVKAEVPKFSEVSLLDCSGDWLEVQSESAIGWLSVGEQCSNPTSTCP
ncbi:SH3 domain-containing protein [Oscillatoria sp. CS-180]|uniref:SH3 domain-containing protein n=1 Tax=Oscillatoria sp. CS-180 TaxID=3021720 RepID=UPI00232A8883|nr:SH3 domain-containing protein [Oscillatoria sp. CS-180]MDB9525571.1 SH3 domain-containing protein [Oscillatoria sp. CS-180]